jgi:hypothetical protein
MILTNSVDKLIQLDYTCIASQFYLFLKDIGKILEKCPVLENK